MNVFVARQPIFDRDKKLVAYELLFRKGMEEAFPEINGDEATSMLLSNTFFTIGFKELTSGKIAFVNFTEDLLKKRIPLLFQKESLMVEVLEDVNPTEEVQAACEEIVENGYRLALDDFVFRADLRPLIELASIIKVDFRLTPIRDMREMIRRLSPFSAKLLAEKVETQEEFYKALGLGFKYFQGFFFGKPETVEGRDIAPAKQNLLRILMEAARNDFDISRMEDRINSDVSISYKLLRYINSAYFKRIRDISSIRQAISLLGERETRKFVTLIATASLASEKPDELINASIIRARICELLGKELSGSEPGELFLLGMFSLLDAILDDSMANIMARLPVPERIKEALVDRSGDYIPFLDLASAYETADWARCGESARTIGVNPQLLPQFYLDAVRWSNMLSTA